MSGLGREEIRAALLQALTPRLREAAPELGPIDGSFRIFESGALDSMAFVDVLREVDDELGNRLLLEELDFEGFETVDGLVDQLHGIQG